tara:strand:+ start:766 stop:1137 length:372 start_codon:yes stop_codon:yes gene_type:complete
MNKLVIQLISRISLSLFLFSLILLAFNPEVNALTIQQNEQLIKRITNDFSKKFCNGVGFGLSQESAKNFAMKENMAIFKKKKGIESIDNKVVAEKVSISVLDKCGYPLKLSEEEWDFTFQNGN